MKLLEREFKRILKQLLTRFKPSDTLSELLDCDKEKQIVTMKVVREKLVFENGTEYISTFK